MYRMSEENVRRKDTGEPGNGGKFSGHRHAESGVSLGGNPLVSQTPSEVDFQLAEIFKEIDRANDELRRQLRYLEDFEKGNKRRLAGENRYSGYTEERIAEAGEKVDLAHQAVLEQCARTKPFDEEFVRRGGWTRAFLVTNAGGHVHSSMSCTTCFPSTEYAWLPEYSGHDEAEIVGDAGESACTVCYPSAPVDVLSRPSKIEAPARRAARLEREAKAAAREAKRQVTGIWNPDGTELREVSWSRQRAGQVIKTARAAEITAVEYLNGILWHGKGEARPNTVDVNYDADERTYERIVTALAAKRGQTEEEVVEHLMEKARAKYKREGGRLS